MAKKKRKVKKKKNFFELSQNGREIFGLFLIVVGIISFISLFSSKMGLMGTFFYKSLSIISGSANFLLPLLFIFWGIIYNLKNLKRQDKYIVASFVIFLCILVFLDGNKSTDLTLVDRLNLSMEYMSITRSGGLIGAMIGFFSYKLLGSLGTFITLTLIILICLYIMLVDLLPEIFKKVSSKKDELIENKNKIIRPKKEKKLKITKSTKREEIKPDDSSNDVMEKEILINDYKDKEEEFNKQVNLNTGEDYIYPKIEFLNEASKKESISNKEIMENAKTIQRTLKNFGIELKITQINKGPVITCYEVMPNPGVKLSKIVSLRDDISMALASGDIRIEAPIPGKSAVGIEVPNRSKESVLLRELIESFEFEKINSNIPICLGKNVEGEIIISNLDDMPHLLIAGATGSGKSVCINNIILSILYKSKPSDVKLMLIDPKIVELSIYNGIPNLLIPVVTDPKKAAFALNWAVTEMEKRYLAFAENKTRDLAGYNKLARKDKNLEKFPQVVIIVDELADLMMVAANEVEDAIKRLAQKARAAGMHLILATQRPSVDVITGTIKANITSRIAFSVSSQIDSRTILDMAGAEKLLGKGDMLFYPRGYSKPKRIQGAFVSDHEVKKVVGFLSENSNEESNSKEILNHINKSVEIKSQDVDPLFKDALRFIVEDEQASISYLQRKLKVGYSRAARIVDQLEERGIIGPHEGSKPRALLMDKEEIEKILGE